MKALKKIFEEEIEREISKYPGQKKEIFTLEKIARLPEPLKKYFLSCGYVNTALMTRAEIVWKNAALCLNRNKKWMPIECYQFNSVLEPCRIVYMKTRLGGLIPFEGRDKCQDGGGNMLIKILKIFTMVDAKGKEMAESALCTVLAEALFLPAYSIQEYIKWTPIDELSAKASLTFNGFSVSGIFRFNGNGEFKEFETDDRYQSADGNNLKKIRWSALCESYSFQGGIKIPENVTALWHEEDGDYPYFRGSIKEIKFR